MPELKPSFAIDVESATHASRRKARQLRSVRRHVASGALLLASVSVVFGCLGPDTTVSLPARYSVEDEQLLVLSDFKLSKNHMLIQDLSQLRQQVAATLDLPLKQKQVVIYLFKTEKAYQEYLDTAYPDLPKRRAYFVGTPRELAVYTFWGERIQEDLRHEFTHGLLHAALKDVPLWIDEGLAEYFEVAGPNPGTINVGHASRIGAALANGWRPDIERLEHLEDFSQMQRLDYQEAWAWVHFMLHSTPEAKEALTEYLHDLRKKKHSTALSKRLKELVPAFEERFLSYVATLHTSSAWAGLRDDSPSRHAGFLQQEPFLHREQF